MALADGPVLATLDDEGEPRGARGVARDLALGAGTVGLAALALVDRGFGARGLIDAFFLVVLVVLSVIDVQQRLLPNRIVLPAAGLLLVAQLAFFPDKAIDWVAAPLGAAAFFLIIRVFNSQSIGLGDVKLMLLLGVALGKSVAFAVFLGAIVAGAWGLLLLVRHGPAARKMTIPYGPFLAFGAAMAVFFVDPSAL